MKARLVSKSRVTPRNIDNEIDSLKREKRYNSSESKEMGVLYRAQQAWDGLIAFRANRARLIRMTYGDQYSDLVEVDGQRMREDEYWAQQGVIPKKNNIIRKMVRSVNGVYKSQDTDFSATARDRKEQKLAEMYTKLLQANRDINRMNELELRLFEEFVISATVFLKESYGYKKRRKDTWTDIVSPNNIFFDGADLQDPRHWDISLIGQIHDLTFGELCSKFCKQKADYTKLKNIYTNANDERFIASYYESKYRNRDALGGSFYTPIDPSLCRVIEVWSQEQKGRYRCHDWATGDSYKVEEKDLQIAVINVNRYRIQEGLNAGMDRDDIALIEYEWFVDNYWYYRFLTPLGDVLQEGETPFEHEEHPYTMKIHPFVDSKPHSLVEDSIDQQKFINELVTMYMLMVKHSSKGLLMFPQDLLPDDIDIEDIAEEYTRVNGIIVYKHKQGVPMPSQLSSNVSNFNISELLKIQIGMFEDVTGVTSAMQGKTPTSGTAAALYAQQTQNASNSLLDMLESFSSFLKEASIKKLSNIQQFYTEERMLQIAGSEFANIKQDLMYLAKDMELDISVSESETSAEYKAISNEFLMQLFQGGAIDVIQLLENGSFPNADKLIKSIELKGQTLDNQNQLQPIQ